VPATFKHIFLAGLEAEPGSCGRGELGRPWAHGDWRSKRSSR
jgi:hypothetical protein